jgi:hypothetical protein
MMGGGRSDLLERNHDDSASNINGNKQTYNSGKKMN